MNHRIVLIITKIMIIIVLNIEIKIRMQMQIQKKIKSKNINKRKKNLIVNSYENITRYFKIYLTEQFMKEIVFFNILIIFIIFVINFVIHEDVRTHMYEDRNFRIFSERA